MVGQTDRQTDRQKETLIDPLNYLLPNTQSKKENTQIYALYKALASPTRCV